MRVNSERARRPAGGVARAVATALVAALASGAARASFLSGDTLDSVADALAWAVLFIVPVIGIAVFWIVHVMPEKIAHRRHHPQTQAIQTLCLLSLVFGGLLWPIAWLWAFTKPVGHKLAYGTDKHEEFFEEAGEKARAGELVDTELAHLKDELEAMRARGALPPRLVKLYEDVSTLQAGAAQAAPASETAAQLQRRSA